MRWQISDKGMRVPFRLLSELPDNVKGILPKHAQEIYRAAFNHAWEQYKSPASRHGNEDRETVAHKVAWSAVKQQYKKQAGRWVMLD